MALVSIITPVYNTEKLLPRCLNSIFSQTFSDFEVILVNDGSKDGSGALCEAYAARDSRIHVIHQENSGVCPRVKNTLRTNVKRITKTSGFKPLTRYFAPMPESFATARTAAAKMR